MNITLRPDIFWVGSIDWTVRDFHSYDTRRGTTYNAYLMLDEQNVLVDAVKGDFADGLLKNVAPLLANRPGLDYIICNHAEPDHAGALPDVLRAYPSATVVCDAKCQKALSEHFDVSGWKFRIVADGDTLSIGRRTLHFIETPMVHWPESMFTLVPDEKLLFSMDTFGQHYACSARFDDEGPFDTAMDELKTYYANIIMPYGKSVVACLNKVDSTPIETIAPSHGVIWRKGVAQVVRAYHDWSACRAKPKVLILYDTMWESTRGMAEAILEGAAQPGIDAQLISFRGTTLTQIAADVLDAGAVAVGSPTLNRGPMPAAAAAMSYLHGLRPTNKTGQAFGSYGWGGGGPDALDESLRTMGWEMLGPPIKSKYRPTPEILDQCRIAGRRLAERACQRAAEGSGT